MAGLFGSKKDTRPIDVGLASLVGSDENTAIEFWKKRFEMTAAVPNEIARVGALTPQMRELSAHRQRRGAQAPDHAPGSSRSPSSRRSSSS